MLCCNISHGYCVCPVAPKLALSAFDPASNRSSSNLTQAGIGGALVVYGIRFTGLRRQPKHDTDHRFLGLVDLPTGARATIAVRMAKTVLNSGCSAIKLTAHAPPRWAVLRMGKQAFRHPTARGW